MTKEEADFISGMNMCDKISNEAYRKIMCHCEEQEPCEDCISRQAVIDIIEKEEFKGDALSEIEKLPSVKPQKPTTVYWTKSKIGGAKVCSVCKAHMGLSNFNFCPNCGAKMEGGSE